MAKLFEAGPKVVPVVDTLEIKETVRLVFIRVVNPTDSAISIIVTDNHPTTPICVIPLTTLQPGGFVTYVDTGLFGSLSPFGVRWTAGAEGLHGYIQARL